MQTFVVYTDASTDAGKGQKKHGYGVCILQPDKNAHIFSGWFQKGSSSNYAEIYAILRALTILPDHAIVLIRTDSQAAIQHLTKATNSDKFLPIKELVWEQMDRFTEVKFSHIKGHQGVDGDPYQNLVDRISHRARVGGGTIDTTIYRYSEEIEKFGMKKP